jgi:hypothetical protein
MHSSRSLPVFDDQTAPLHDAMDRHDADRRARFQAASNDSLSADRAGWIEIGEAIAALAQLVTARCRASAFVFAAPNAVELGLRIVDAVDEPLDAAAFVVVSAAARRILSRA